jgi:UDP-glucose 4-epimerase
VITETAAGKRKECVVYGDDYDTRDGSCVRDYIHVEDLASAHTLAVDYLLSGRNEASYEVFNLGIGEGVTVIEAIEAFEKTSGQKLNYRIGPRRPGDIVSIYSNYEKAKNRLGWEPKYGIEDIMKTAWTWEKNRLY